MTFQTGVKRVENLDVEAAARNATGERAAVYVLPNSGIADRESLFDAVRASLPLDPPLIGTRSWDALSDSLWGGIDALDSSRVVIVWPNSAEMERVSPDAYKMALDVFADVAASVGDPAATDGSPKEVGILIG